MGAIELRNVSFAYPERKEKTLDGLSLTVEQGEFLVVCGPSGSGKTTLLRQLKTVLAPHGVRTGDILFEGRPLDELDQREQSQKIGFVQQSPDNQIVTDKVWHELAFGLESLGYDTPTIRRRVAEMASFFGIEGWFYKNVTELSGGQKQLLNLASIMAMQPDVLILDEPTSQLDPIAASDFLTTLGKLNRELGTTVILTEHRLEEALPLATEVAVLDGGRLLCSGTPVQVGEALRDGGHAMFLSMPTPMRVWAAVESEEFCPVTVREGKDWLTQYAASHELRPLPDEPTHACPEENAIACEGLWFKYEKDAPDVVKGLSLEVKRGGFVALLGGNGTGKTTLLKLLSGLEKPYRGDVQVHGSVGVLPQNPQAIFVKKTVGEDLFELLKGRGLDKRAIDERVAQVTALCRLTGLLERHPYDLSGGEQQRSALAKVLLLEPEILLLDEPTKGMDGEFKQSFAQLLRTLLGRGVTVLMVSHDIEFCAQYAHRCALVFDGGIVTQGTPREFFSGNSFYTTSANRMARHLLPQAVTAEDVATACGGILPPEPELPGDVPPLPEPKEAEPPRGTSRSRRPDYVVQAPKEKRRIAKRTAVAAALILLLIPLTLFVGLYYLDRKQHYAVSLLTLLETMLPFFLVFEGRKPQARELVVIAVLCALGVASRAALIMLPQFKPTMAVTVIAGVALGGETGFLVGAVTMLASNVFLGQGPHTPWQMFAMGLIGFLAGVLFRKGWLRRSRGPLCVFGALAAVLVYGGIMNTASALMVVRDMNLKIWLSYCLSGLPFDCVQAVATGLFLWFGGEIFLEKLDRIKVKYGLVE